MGSEMCIRDRYSSETLLQAKDRCLCVNRQLRRRLQYFRIYVRHISVIVSSRHDYYTRDNSKDIPRRHLVRVPRAISLRKPKRPSTYPSLMLSNVRSLNNKLDEVSHRISSEKPDICVFTESWLNDDSPDSAISVDNYSVFRQDRQDRKGGGIVCYIRSVFSCCVVDLQAIPPLNACRSELLTLFVKDFSLLLIALYHPFWNDSAAHHEALSCLATAIDHSRVLFGQDLRIILCGDFNNLRDHFSTISSLTQLSSVVTLPTRGAHCLDQVFVNFAMDTAPSFLPPIGRSDHLVVLWKPTPERRIPARKLKIRKLSQSNLCRFRVAVASVDWLSLVDHTTDLDDATVTFLRCLFYLFDFHVPLRTVRIRSAEPPWMRLSLKVLIDDRDRAYHKNQWARYRRLRNDDISHIRHLKTKFMTASASSGNSAKAWKSLRLLGRFTKTRSTTGKFTVDQFRDFFASNFQASSDLSDFVNSTACPPVLSSFEVLSYLRRVPNKSCGPDNVPPFIFRDFAEMLCPAITRLFNRSLSEGYVPMCFKQANIVPIQKRVRPHELSHFRPISLLPVLSKVFEKIVAKKFIIPLVKNKVDPHQFAYIPRPGSGTTCALVLSYDKIVRFLDSASGAVRLMSIDYTKAFDKLSHSSIMSACSAFHFPPFLVNWIVSFLSFRSQRVIADGAVSSWSTVSSGIPQGSILGPILFCLVIDSLNPICTNSFFVKYADDVSVLHFVRTSSDDDLQREWDHIVSWSNSVKLPINYCKCSVLNFVTRKNMSLSDVLLPDGTAVETVQSLSFLGVTLSHDMKWNSHVDKIVKKACKRLFILINLRRSACPKHLIFRSYAAFIRSVLVYCYPVWCNAPAYLMQKLSLVERRALRIIGADDDFDVPSVFEVAKTTCNKLMHSISQCDDHPLRAMFDFRNVCRTRCSNHLVIPFARTSRFSHSFIKFCKNIS